MEIYFIYAFGDARNETLMAFCKIFLRRLRCDTSYEETYDTAWYRKTMNLGTCTVKQGQKRRERTSGVRKGCSCRTVVQESNKLYSPTWKAMRCRNSGSTPSRDRLDTSW